MKTQSSSRYVFKDKAIEYSHSPIVEVTSSRSKHYSIQSLFLNQKLLQVANKNQGQIVNSSSTLDSPSLLRLN